MTDKERDTSIIVPVDRDLHEFCTALAQDVRQMIDQLTAEVVPSPLGINVL